MWSRALSAPRLIDLRPQVSTYSFETHVKTSQIRVLNIKDGASHLISENPAASDPVWISQDEIAYLKPTDRGCTALMAQRVTETSSESVFLPTQIGSHGCNIFT